jgi:hypothetical protein
MRNLSKAPAGEDRLIAIIPVGRINRREEQE